MSTLSGKVGTIELDEKQQKGLLRTKFQSEAGTLLQGNHVFQDGEATLHWTTILCDMVTCRRYIGI